MESYRLVDRHRWVASARCLCPKTEKDPKSNLTVVLEPQPELGPNHHPSTGTFGPAAGCCQKDPGFVWPTGLAKSEGLADAKSPLSQDGVLIQPPLNPLLAGMWWEVSAEAKT